MKKLTLLTAALFTVTALGSRSLTVQAQSPLTDDVADTYTNQKRVVVLYGKEELSSSLIEKLLDCIAPSLRPSLPETEWPETERPDAENPEGWQPDTEQPDMERPETEQPENGGSDVEKPSPDNEQSETEKPENETPDSERPDDNEPQPEQPDTEQPDGNKPQPETPENTPNNDAEQDSEHASYIRQIIRLVNKERAKEGLSALTENSKINAAAQVRAREIVTSFSHTRPNGSSFATALKEQGVSYRRAGENIAWGQRTPEEVVTAWMNSPGHRANILNPSFKAIGIGYYKDASDVKYWTQLFTS